eukprot:CAMPEP_0173462056 /NCGR_PEP_ID=MMETSP1357-20121228/65980_1 /TAXON_ID=77926 /ORGANISM="Hemiselmis rufescens, Strain PCC563" /LENGTH=70 /DNA_ID=CAMNT_0014429763 /DNA_START=134 /DNA_END=343 /DNA_ORIENTATION=+
MIQPYECRALGLAVNQCGQDRGSTPERCLTCIVPNRNRGEPDIDWKRSNHPGWQISCKHSHDAHQGSLPK